MHHVNFLYSKIGFLSKITSKSAKVLGTSLAFELGMSNDHVMLLGRWKNPATAQYYRSVNPATLLKVYGTVNLKPESLDFVHLVPSTLLQPRALSHEETTLTSHGSRNSTGSILSTTSSSGPILRQSAPLSEGSQSRESDLVRLFLLSTMLLALHEHRLNHNRYPLPQINPTVYLNGERDLVTEETQWFLFNFLIYFWYFLINSCLKNKLAFADITSLFIAIYFLRLFQIIMFIFLFIPIQYVSYNRLF